MTTTTTRRATRRTAILGVLAAIILSAFSAAPASAATFTNRSGYTGGVTLNGAMTIGRDQMVYNTCCSYVLKRFSSAGVTVTATTAYAGTQRVYGVYQLQRWYNGAWQNLAQSGAYSGVVSAGGTLSFPGVTLDAPNYTGQFAYRIRLALSWERATTGTLLGSQWIIADRVAENACATRFTRCTPYTDSVVM